MNLTDELTKALKKKVKNILNKKSLSPNTSTNGKNVSWAEFHEYEPKPKRNLRSTPYPNPTKKIKISNSTPKTLSFDDSDSDEFFEKENTFTTSENITELCKPKSQGTKRKRSSITASSEDWTVTKCSEIKPDKNNKSCDNHNITMSSEESSTEDEGTFISEDKNLFNQFDFDSSDESDDLNTSHQIFKPKIMNLNKCTIIKPPVDNNYTNNENLENGNNEELEITTDNILDTPDSPQAQPKIRFTKVIKSFINETHCILILKHPIKLYVHGKLHLSVLYGAVEILGHILQYDNQKEFEIYSPKGHSYLSFETVEPKSNDKETLKKILTDAKVPTKQLKEYLYRLKDTDCVIAIRSLNNNLTNYISNHIAQYIFPKPIQCEKNIEKKLHCLFEVENSNWKVYKKNYIWNSCLESSLYNLNQGFSCTMICGGKSVGKSTLYRHMINALLNETDKVVCIDLDPGQTEFTIPGCVSVTIIDEPIFGPNFTHLKTPEKSFFVGDVNLTNCVDRYISSVKELLMFCNKNIDKKYPWVVNFMGFSKSFGVDLTVSTIKLVCPTTVVQIFSSIKNRNYPSALTTDYVQNYIYSFPIITPPTKINYNLIEMDSAAEEKIEGEFQFDPKQLRDMTILSYFSQMTEIGKEVTSVVPYSVKLSSVKLIDLSYNKENILAVFNGNLVALCKTTEKEPSFDCLGFGIVRGIDRDASELYLLTPVAENELENVNTLVRGAVNLPPSLYMTKGRQGLVPYILLGTQQGTSSIPKRSYFNLKSLFKKEQPVII